MQNIPTRIQYSNCSRDLEPIFEMLREKEKLLPRDEWLSLVNATRKRIVQAPEQYLSIHVKSSLLLTDLIDTLFNERLN
jgi:hypothetical protein